MAHDSRDCASPSLFEISDHLSNRSRNPGVVTGVTACGKLPFDGRSSAGNSSLQSPLIATTSAGLVSACQFPTVPKGTLVCDYRTGYLPKQSVVRSQALKRRIAEVESKGGE